MDISDKAGTLRAQEHGHQPIVCFRPKTANCTEYCEDDISATITLGYHYGGGGDAALILENKTDIFPVESFGHDERSTQFSRGGCCDTLTQSDYKQPIIVCYALEGNGARPSHRGGVLRRWEDVHIEHD